VVEVTGNQASFNLGSFQGTVDGTIFDVVEKKPPVIWKGNPFIPEPSLVAKVKVVCSNDDFSYRLIKDHRRTKKPVDKQREIFFVSGPNEL